ncbi:MAG: substrate-binding domain-containing protein [Propionibacteriaceae bacterium]|nr:substrate-binding domain-containing protein [Propionibacteriaceae bacterium]
MKRSVVMVVAVMVLAGCTPAPVAPTETPPPTRTPIVVEKPTLSDGFVNRLDGSTATIPLGSAVMTALTGSDDQMVFNKTDQAYENLIDKKKDLILVTAPSEDELQAAADAGVELEVIPVVKDALVFLANTSNPVQGLTQDEVSGVYSGQITNWKQIGGEDAPIIAYQRPVNSGSQTLFLQLAMKDTAVVEAPPERTIPGMEGLVDAIADFDAGPDSLGYSVFYFATQMYMKDTTKLLSIDSVMPSALSVADGTYPYLTNYYAVIRKDTPVNDEVRQVVNWMLSDEAQQLASSINYVPLESVNIVDQQPTYGFFGSTEQNTTQSSGTGGTQRQSVSLIPSEKVHCTSEVDKSGTSGLTGMTIDGHDAMAAAIEKWYADTPSTLQGVTGVASGCSTVQPTQSFTSVSLVSASSYDTIATATISDRGTVMGLSDFFYDGVNYIDFINHSLAAIANSATPPDNWEPTQTWYPSVRPFSGIPADYPNVAVTAQNGWVTLTIAFPEGNPFFPVAQNLTVPLPADLSPYGRFVSQVWTSQSATGQPQLVPHLTTTSTASDTDQALDDKIMSIATAHPEFSCISFDFSLDRLTLIGNTTTLPCGKDDGADVLVALPTWLATLQFDTWADATMSVNDLPQPWQTTMVFVSRNPQNPGSEAVIPLSPDAHVTRVWPMDDDRLVAEVIDAGQTYWMTYQI